MTTIYQSIGPATPYMPSSILLLPTLATFLTRPKEFPRAWVIGSLLLIVILDLIGVPFGQLLLVAFIPIIPEAFRRSNKAGFASIASMGLVGCLLTVFMMRIGPQISVDNSEVTVRNSRGEIKRMKLELGHGTSSYGETIWLKTDDQDGEYPLHSLGSYDRYWGPKGLTRGSEVREDILDQIARNSALRTGR